jgi:hypothetical protein
MKIGTGIKQKREGKKIKPRELELSKKRKEALRDVETRATSTRLPGQSRIEEGLEESTATTLKSAGESAKTPQERMAVAAKAGTEESKSRRALGVKAATFSEGRKDKAVAAKERFAGEEEALESKLRDEEVARKSDLEEAGAKNIYSGVKGAAALGVGTLTKSAGEGSRMVEDTAPGAETGDIYTKSDRVEIKRKLRAEEAERKRREKESRISERRGVLN